jgi:hypothetical protein
MFPEWHCYALVEKVDAIVAGENYEFSSRRTSMCYKNGKLKIPRQARSETIDPCLTYLRETDIQDTLEG